MLQYVVTSVFFITFAVSNCGQHWRPFKSGCLRLFQDRKDWVAANQHCATLNTCNRRNGRLISIFSQDDNDQIDNSRILLACPQGMVSHNFFSSMIIFFLDSKYYSELSEDSIEGHTFVSANWPVDVTDYGI